MQYLRQSTASQEISLGFFLDSTDGNTEETGLTIANTDIKIRKGGTTTLANKNSGDATHISNGVYSAVLDATDTDTLGQLEIYVHVAGALAVKNIYMVLPVASFDALITNGLNDIAATDIVSAGAITTLSGAVVNVDVVDVTTINDDMRGTDSAATATALAAVDANVDAILVDTGTAIPAQISGLNNITVGQILAGGDIDGFTMEECLKLLLSALAAKLSGATTTTITIRAADDSKDRIIATVDADGNRSAVTLDALG